MLRGGRGGAKSHHAALKMIFGIMGIDPYLEDGELKFKKSKKLFRGVISRDTYENIRDGQYQDIVDLIKLYELEDNITIGKSPFSFYCPATGFNIIAKATTQSKKNAKAKTKGIKDPTMVWIDELPDMEEDHFVKLTMSTRKAGSNCQIICTHNTDIEPDHWVRKMFYEKERKNTFYHFSTYKNNLANLDKDAVADYEEQKEIDPERYATDVLGQWGRKKVISPFATQFDEEKHVMPCQLIPNIPLRISFDFNLDPFAFLYYQFWFDKEGYHLHFFEEETIPSGDLDEACDRILLKYRPQLLTATVTGDYSGTSRNMNIPDKSSNFELIRRKLGLKRSQLDLRPNPRHANSREDCNYALRHLDIRIDAKCVNLIRDLRTVEVKPDQSIIKDNRKVGNQLADHLDAFRYSVNSQEVQQWKKQHQKFSK